MRLMVFGGILISCAVTWSADYLMEGADSGRTGWLRDDKSFGVDDVRNMKLLWKTKLDSVPREMHNLFPPLIATGVNTASPGLEVKTQRQLHNARVARRDVLPEARIHLRARGIEPRGGVETGELGVVEHVVQFPAELQRLCLAYAKILVGGGVPGEDARPDERVAASIAECACRL